LQFRISNKITDRTSYPVLINSGADPDPECDAFCAVLTPGSGIQDRKNPDPGFGMKILDHIYESLKKMFGLIILNLFDADPGSF
jgi:hypothetical protein